MARRGFTYFEQPNFVPSIELLLGGVRRWGPTDEAVARESGYHAGTEIDQLVEVADAARAREQAFVDGMTPEERDDYFLALDGSAYGTLSPVISEVPATVPGSSRVLTVQLAGGEQSCRREIAPALGQDIAVFEALNSAVTEASADVDQLAAGDEAFRKSLDEWAECFRSEGFEAEDPLVALDLYIDNGDDPSEAEIAAALADIACKRSVGLLDSWSEAIRRAEGVIGEDIVAELEYWLELRQGILLRAADLLETG